MFKHTQRLNRLELVNAFNNKENTTQQLRFWVIIEIDHDYEWT